MPGLAGGAIGADGAVVFTECATEGGDTGLEFVMGEVSVATDVLDCGFEVILVEKSVEGALLEVEVGWLGVGAMVGRAFEVGHGVAEGLQRGVGGHGVDEGLHLTEFVAKSNGGGKRCRRREMASDSSHHFVFVRGEFGAFLFL